MARVEVFEISNISQQLVTFGFSRIDARLGASPVDSRDEGILKLAAGSSISIEAQRVERGELESIQKLGLIRFESRFVVRPDIPQPPCFDFDTRTMFVGYSITLTPSNLFGPVAYWSIQSLPSGWSFNSSTGVITAPVQTVTGSYPIVLSAVGPDNLVCTINHTVQVENPDVIDLNVTVGVPTAVAVPSSFTVAVGSSQDQVT